MKKIKVGYCGNIAKVADEIYLSEHFELSVAFIEEDKLDEKMLTFCTLREVPIVIISNKKNLESKVKEQLGLKCLIVCGFGVIIPKSLLDFMPAYNFHPGRLPDYKGRHPTFFATKHGEPKIEITLHKVSPGIDEGDIIYIFSNKYRYDENETDILKKIQLGVEMMLPILYEFIEGRIKGKLNIGGKYYQPVNIEDKTFTVNDKPSDILNIIRAQAPYDGGIFSESEKLYWVKGATVEKTYPEMLYSNKVIYDRDENIIGIRLDEIRWIKFINIKEKING